MHICFPKLIHGMTSGKFYCVWLAIKVHIKEFAWTEDPGNERQEMYPFCSRVQIHKDERLHLKTD